MTDVLQALYARIPSFDCDRGCHECCEPVPFTEAEWAAVKGKLDAKDGECPFACPEGCSIYEDRPFVCRLFGATDVLPCPRGYAPAKRLSRDEAAEMIGQYRALAGNVFVLQSSHLHSLMAQLVKEEAEMNGRCEDCAYMQPRDPAGYECRRRAPEAPREGLGIRRFPIVHGYDWCGEFKEKEEKQ